jgi:PhnB protein
MERQESAMAEGPKTPPPMSAGDVIPYLTVKGGKAAVDFYTRAFGATEVYRQLAEDGERLMHSRLTINGGTVMLSDDFPEYHGGRPTPAPTGVTMHLQVDDADVWYDRAVAAGATARMPLQDMFWGDRYGQLADPFGHSWSIAAPVKTG